VRRAAGRDLEHLARLRFEWRVGEGAEVGAGIDEFVDAFTRWVEQHESTHIGFVASLDGEPVGIVFLALLDRVPGPERWHRRAGALQSLYVTPPRRGVGIGARLCQEVISTARELRLDYVTVHPSERSFPLYRRLGFAPSGDLLELDLRAER
jgi:GNAT superfamily N-acetyltransferase